MIFKKIYMIRTMLGLPAKPKTDQYTLVETFGRILIFLSTDSGYTFGSQLCFSPLYLPNTLYTRNACSHTYISSLYASKISLKIFSLSDILRSLIPNISEIFSPFLQFIIYKQYFPIM